MSCRVVMRNLVSSLSTITPCWVEAKGLTKSPYMDPDLYAATLDPPSSGLMAPITSRARPYQVARGLALCRFG